MRVGLVWAAETLPLVRMSVRFERYVRGLLALGHDVLTITPEGTTEGYPYPTQTVAKPEELSQPDFWKKQSFDIGILVTWLRMASILQAMRNGCRAIISLADSDGIVSTRVHPAQTRQRMLAMQPTTMSKLRAWKFWWQLYLGGYRQQDAEILASASVADRIVIGSPGAAIHLQRVFEYHRQPRLTEKLQINPYPVDAFFLTNAVQTARKNQIVSIGRWEDPQKNATLLRDTIRKVVSQRTDITFLIVGPNGESLFAPLEKQYPQVRYLGVQKPEAVAELLGSSRSLLLSSGWESGPIVAHETLCLGGSLIGPATIPSFSWFTSVGPFGTTAKEYQAKALSQAVLQEMRAWDEGRRDPLAIANRWRPMFDPKEAMQKMIKDLPHAR